jgi:predicted nuclease of predicted toxin-antitoxin system
MPIAYYMDEHVQTAITRGLRRRGIDVLTIQEDGFLHADDDVILDRAMALGRAVFSRDEDFLAEAARRQVVGVPFAGVVYAHQLGATIGQCVNDLELIASVYEPADMANNVVYLPL